MAGNALSGRAFIHTISMTLGAGKLSVMPDQWKGCVVMVEGDVGPATGDMAGGTVGTELTVVFIFRCMACKASCGRPLIHAVGVACGAQDGRMKPGQREACVIVVEVHIRPFGGFMTCGTVRPELTVVFVFRGMAGITVFGRPLINIIHVAGCADNGRMRANQRERGIGMIECRAFPRTRVVT